MSKLKKIIKDIVKQQIEFANKIDKHSDKEFIRQLTYKQLANVNKEISSIRNF